MTETPLDEPELPPSLRLLKRLVTVLTLTMIFGVITVVGLLVTRMPNMNGQPDLPASLTLPDGAVAAAVTVGTGWIGVVTTDNRFLVFDTLGQLLQVVAIDLPSP